MPSKLFSLSIDSLYYYVTATLSAVFTDSKQYLGQPPYGNLKASTAHQYKRGSSCQPGDGHILSNKAWCAALNNGKQRISGFMLSNKYQENIEMEFYTY